MKVDAVVLGGGQVSEKLTRASAAARGLLKVNGTPMVDYVCRALRNCPSIDNIVLVVPSHVLDRDWGPGVEVTAGNGSIAENMLAGLDRLQQDKPVLTVAADIPLITPEAIEDFLDRCDQTEAQVCYPIIPKEEVEKKFPGSARTYVTLKEGAFTGGNVMLIEPSVVQGSRSVVEELYSLRKSPVKLTKRLGFKFILKFLVRRLSLKEVEEVASRLIKANGCAIIAPYPEIGVDVDKDSDLELAERVLGNSGDGHG